MVVEKLITVVIMITLAAKVPVLPVTNVCVSLKRKFRRAES